MSIELNRIDGDKELNKPIERIEIAIGEHRYTLTDEFGRLHIHSHSDFMDVRPCVANQVTVKGFYRG